MKNLRRLALFLAVIMIGTGLSACGGNKKEEKPAAQSSSAVTSAEASVAQSSSTGTNEEASVAQSSSAGTNENEASAENTVENTAEKLKAVLTIGYIGTDVHGSTVYWAVNADATYGVLLVVSADESSKVSFIGDIVSNGDELTITDKSSGNSTTVNVQQVTTNEGEKAIQLTDKDGDPTVLFPVEADKVIDAILAADTK